MAIYDINGADMRMPPTQSSTANDLSVSLIPSLNNAQPTTMSIRYIGQKLAQQIDEELMSSSGAFSLDQVGFAHRRHSCEGNYHS